MDQIRHSIQIDRSSVKRRGTWGGKFDFMLSCIGYSVGLGTIWRFPYLCYRNGGGAFLIPYMIFLILMGMPLVVLEIAYGQFSSLSPIEVWRMSPLFQGVGFGMVVISAIVCVYYNVIIAWTLHYFVKSFSWELPWASCNHTWNTNSCYVRHADDNITDLLANNITRKSPSEEFFENNVLVMSKGIDDFGVPQWHLAIALLVAWIFIVLVLIKGVKSSGKVVYVTATLPYVILFSFLIRACLLEGAVDGIRLYIVPEWSKLLTFRPWGDAAMQLFYSTGAAWGALITLSSYNKFKNNFYRDAIILAFTDTFTAFVSGFVIFATIGFMAHQTSSSIEKVVVDGPGLVFVVYPAAIAHMPGAPIWAVLFFIFLFTVGVDSQFGMFETVLSALFDHYPFLRRKKALVTMALGVVEFLMGLLCICSGGIYFFQIMDWYSSTFSLMILSLTECAVISWIYGTERFYYDMTMMLGFRPCAWWGICWRFITPVLIAFILLVAIIQHTPVTYGSYNYPEWAIIVGWMFALCSILPLPVIAIIKLMSLNGPFVKRVKILIRPSFDWGPSVESGRLEEYQKVEELMALKSPVDRWRHSADSSEQHSETSDDPKPPAAAAANV